MPERYPRVFALLFTACLFALIWLYVREFPVLSNTIEIAQLLAGSLVAGLLVAGLIVWRYRRRFLPWSSHAPEVILIFVGCLIFSPLAGSRLNRAFGKTKYQSFVFVAEVPYVASAYGLVRFQKVQASGYHLLVRDNAGNYRFKYVTQSFFPNTRAGESILLPIRTGLFGVRIMMLQ